MKQELIDLVRNDCLESASYGRESIAHLRNQSILITGGTGFVGKWLTEMVICLNEEFGFNIQLHLLARDVISFRRAVPHLANNKNVHLIEQDIRSVVDLPDDIGWIIHAANSPDSREHLSNPLKTIDVISKGTSAILEASLRLPNLNKFVHVSSNYIYGQTLGDCNSINATYGESKRMAETICAVYRNQQRVPVVIVRPFSFLGPYQGLEKPWAINNFIRDAILGGPIRILGNEGTVRSYLYGSDLAYWMYCILANGKVGSAYNLGSAHPISLRQLAEKVISNFGNKIEIVVKSSKDYPSAPSITIPDISSLTSDIGVQQMIDLETSLKQTLRWNILSR